VANDTMQTSAAGLAALRQREGIRYKNYNDIANNCTFGIGTLVHVGPCTADELKQQFSDADVDTALRTELRDIEASVRRQIGNGVVTQAQFDSLVSYAYNVGPTGARPVLEAASRGQNTDVVSLMNQAVYIHPRDARGRRLAPVRSQGLVNRRNDEALPFIAQQRAR